MDLEAVAVGLAANAATVAITPKLTTYEWMASSIVEPAVLVSEVDIDFDKTYQRGMDQYLFTVRALVGHMESQDAHRYLNRLMAGSGPTSLKTAIESDRTLGGAAHDLRVERVRGRRLYQWAGKEYIGCEATVFVIGPGG